MPAGNSHNFILVPSELTEQEFWQRFFFRAHQIKEEEEKRKALLQGPNYRSYLVLLMIYSQYNQLIPRVRRTLIGTTRILRMKTQANGK
jgi:hypothetical protein